MTVFKCKMCGGALEIATNETVAECRYCGTKQTLPRLNDDRRANLFDRANHLRRNNEFDKAEAMYEQLLTEDSTDAETYWSLVLCRYGVEYVKDPATHKQMPTVNRAQYTSVFDDGNYKEALRHADAVQRELYEQEANAINEIQKSILAISQKEKPFDVFICYKETDQSGRRTPDSVLAQELYYQLKNEGYNVFFSRITLEDKLGSAYEPYIFAALNSAKVMVVIGTNADNLNAPWVKNEWSRYLGLIRGGAQKMLIPAYKDMDPYDLPEEFSHLQAQDMSKLGFMQDLTRGIGKIIAPQHKKATSAHGDEAVANLIKRTKIALEDNDWQGATDFSERALDLAPENAEAYLGKLLAELHLSREEDLANVSPDFANRNTFKRTLMYADESLKARLLSYKEAAESLASTAKNEEQYSNACSKMSHATNARDYETAAKMFERLGTYRDAAKKRDMCLSRAQTLHLQSEQHAAEQYQKASAIMQTAATSKELLRAADIFHSISHYENSAEYERVCREKVTELSKSERYADAMRLMNTNQLDNLTRAAQLFESISGWKDADDRAQQCYERIENDSVNKRSTKIAIALAVIIPALAVFCAILCFGGSGFLSDVSIIR